jgi:non-lysosomal glucosylceramidase
VTFPFGPGKGFSGQGAWSAMYFNECMSGFEHQAAAHMVWEGLTLEGLAVTRAIHDRYHARLRNPYNEIECSDHYARAMASYGTFLAACGFEYHGPAGRLGFAPRVSPERFQAAFTAAEGWGTLSQVREAGVQRQGIEVKWGRLRLRRLVFTPVGGGQPEAVQVSVAGRKLGASHTLQDGKVVVALDADVNLEAGQRLEALLHFPAR